MCRGQGVWGGVGVVVRKWCWGEGRTAPGRQTMDSGWNRPAAFPVGNCSVSARPSWGRSERVVGADLSTYPSHHHQPPPPSQESESPAPTLGGATTQGLKPERRPLPWTGKRTAHRVPHPSDFMITAPSPEIVPGAGVGAYGVGSDGLMRGPQAEDP